MQRPWISSPSYKSALDAVIEVRKRNGVSQRDLARRLGKPQSFVSKIEKRERRLDFVEFVALARALGLEPSELLNLVSAAIPDPLEF